jgi:hypothetical protein
LATVFNDTFRLLRWSLQLWSKSKGAYLLLRKHLPLPSISTLNSYRHGEDNGSGWRTNKFERLQALAQQHKLEGPDLICGLSVDEIKIEEGIVYSSQGIEGIQDLETVQSDLASLERYFFSKNDETQNQETTEVHSQSEIN